MVNTRLDAMIQKYRPEEDKKAYGYTAFVKPIRDVYRDEDQVKRMDSIMSILALAILFIASFLFLRSRIVPKRWVCISAAVQVEVRCSQCFFWKRELLLRWPWC